MKHVDKQRYTTSPVKCPFSSAKNAHGMASEGTVVTLGSMGGILYRDTNWNKRCSTKV